MVPSSLNEAAELAGKPVPVTLSMLLKAQLGVLATTSGLLVVSTGWCPVGPNTTVAALAVWPWKTKQTGPGMPAQYPFQDLQASPAAGWASSSSPLSGATGRVHLI